MRSEPAPGARIEILQCRSLAREDHLTRNLKGGQPFAAKCVQPLFESVQPLDFRQRESGGHQVAGDRVPFVAHGDVYHVRQILQHILDLRRIYLLAPDIDDLRAPSEYLDILVTFCLTTSPVRK